MPNPQRGEIWLVDLGMTAKVRPCLVLSVPILEQDRALITLIPHTTSTRNSRFKVSIENRFLRPGAFDTQNIITIPTIKLLRKIGTLSVSDSSLVE